MAEIQNFNLEYSSANKEAVTKKIQDTLTQLESDYNSAINSWEIIKRKFKLEQNAMQKLEEIGSSNGDENMAKREFNKIVTSMENLISSLGTIDKSWVDVSSQVTNAINNFDVTAAGSSPGGHNVE